MVQDLSYSFGNSIGLGDNTILQIFGIRHGNINCRYSLHRSSKIIEGFCLIDYSHNFCADSRLRKTILNSDQSSSLLNTLDNCISIKRFNRP